MNYHYPSEASLSYINLRSITGQSAGYLHPIAYATARFVASANKGDANLAASTPSGDTTVRAIVMPLYTTINLDSIFHWPIVSGDSRTIGQDYFRLR